jgi:hypothetical protein
LNFPNPKFNIVLALPDGNPDYVHAQCFIPVANVLRYGLEDLGYSVIFGEGLSSEHLNILLGYHFLDGQPLPPEFPCIVYQLEGLFEKQEWPLHITETLRSPNCVVWDYSQRNIEFLAQRGIRAFFKPMGFHPKMYTVDNRQPKDVDVLFYGSGNERRNKILRELGKCCNLKAMAGVYGPERDDWISRSKIVLCMHYYEVKLFDEVRISFLLNNKSFIVVEDTPNRRYSDFITYSSYDKLVETCKYYLQNDRLREQTAERAFREFSRIPETGLLQTALHESLGAKPR